MRPGSSRVSKRILPNTRISSPALNGPLLTPGRSPFPTRPFSDTVRPLATPTAESGETSSTGFIPTITPTKLSREQLVRLHRLSALNPPEEGSEEEVQLLKGLGELVGLMELVKEVELEGDVGELLAEGVGEVVINAETTKVERSTSMGKRGGSEAPGEGEGLDEKTGKELLNWATRRVGDFYAHRAAPRPGS